MRQLSKLLINFVVQDCTEDLLADLMIDERKEKGVCHVSVMGEPRILGKGAWH